MKDIVRFVLYVKKKGRELENNVQLDDIFPTVSSSSPCVATLHLLHHLYL